MARSRETLERQLGECLAVVAPARLARSRAGHARGQRQRHPLRPSAGRVVVVADPEVLRDRVGATCTIRNGIVCGVVRGSTRLDLPLRPEIPAAVVLRELVDATDAGELVALGLELLEVGAAARAFGQLDVGLVLELGFAARALFDCLRITVSPLNTHGRVVASASAII